MNLILASTSRIRQDILNRAGLAFTAVRPAVDEARLKSEARHLAPGELAEKLAAAKSVSVANRAALVIGADQVLNFAGTVFDKPETTEAARKQLTALRGETHLLETALCCAREGQVVWRHADRATLTMRRFSDEFLDRYLAAQGDDVTKSVGGYKLEGQGIQLFEKIEGDFFAMLGLPLLPLLGFLRGEGLAAS